MCLLRGQKRRFDACFEMPATLLGSEPRRQKEPELLLSDGKLTGGDTASDYTGACVLEGDKFKPRLTRWQIDRAP
jgi:hypothetical protein